MMPEQLTIDVGLQISKPANEVFEAIVDPQHMVHYFISQSTGRMVAGEAVVWKFPEFSEEATIRVGKLVPSEYVSFYWEIDGSEMHVQISLAPVTDHATIVRIKEESMPVSESGINWLKGNTEGWANFLCCLKAYMEYGINLRKAAFDYRSDLKK